MDAAAAATAPLARGCEHYRRGCELLAPCCNEWFTCRVCHDAVKSEGERDPKRAHTLDRRAVARVRCLGCRAEQAPARECAGCAAVLGDYFCALCNLFDDEGVTRKGLWHCAGCGICRAGGEANFFHCAGCASCLALATRDSHVCRAGLHDACPLCLEHMHTSRSPAQLLPCGHGIHVACFAEYSKTCYKCPTCARSAGDMRRAWAALDLEVAQTPMPLEYRSKWARVLCNDCAGSGRRGARRASASASAS
jgi:RING finger/CHY zinc finger protein 1